MTLFHVLPGFCGSAITEFSQNLENWAEFANICRILQKTIFLNHPKCNSKANSKFCLYFASYPSEFFVQIIDHRPTTTAMMEAVLFDLFFDFVVMSLKLLENNTHNTVQLLNFTEFHDDIRFV